MLLARQSSRFFVSKHLGQNINLFKDDRHIFFSKCFIQNGVCISDKSYITMKPYSSYSSESIDDWKQIKVKEPSYKIRYDIQYKAYVIFLSVHKCLRYFNRISTRNNVDMSYKDSSDTICFSKFLLKTNIEVALVMRRMFLLVYVF